MGKCEVCGNDYDKTFQVTRGARVHTFDCFECAIQALAPVCRHCGCKVIGHGVEAEGLIFCCANCAAKEGVRGMKDRIETRLAGVP
jgi:hypothetical protein